MVTADAATAAAGPTLTALHAARRSYSTTTAASTTPFLSGPGSSATGNLVPGHSPHVGPQPAAALRDWVTAAIEASTSTKTAPNAAASNAAVDGPAEGDLVPQQRGHSFSPAALAGLQRHPLERAAVSASTSLQALHQQLALAHQALAGPHRPLALPPQPTAADTTGSGPSHPLPRPLSLGAPAGSSAATGPSARSVGKAGGSSVAEARVSRLCRLPLAARFTSSSGGRDISQPPAAPLVATQAALQLLGVGLASAAAQVVEDGLVQDPSLMLKLDGLISATLDHTPCAFTHCAALRTAFGQVFVQLEFSACYVALDPGRQEAEPVLVILLQRMTPPAAPPAATPTPLTHTDPSLPLPTPAAATVLQLGQASQVAAGQQAVGAGAGPVQGPGAVGGGSGGAQLVSGSQLSSQLTFQLQLSHLALAHATAIITIMTLDGQVLYQNGRSVEYLGFMTGQAAAAGQSLHAPHHLLRRIFAADPLALDALMVATGQGQVWSGLVHCPRTLRLSGVAQPHPAVPPSGSSAAPPWPAELQFKQDSPGALPRPRTGPQPALQLPGLGQGQGPGGGGLMAPGALPAVREMSEAEASCSRTASGPSSAAGSPNPGSTAAPQVQEAGGKPGKLSSPNAPVSIPQLLPHHPDILSPLGHESSTSVWLGPDSFMLLPPSNSPPSIGASSSHTRQQAGAVHPPHNPESQGEGKGGGGDRGQRTVGPTQTRRPGAWQSLPQLQPGSPSPPEPSQLGCLSGEDSRAAAGGQGGDRGRSGPGPGAAPALRHRLQLSRGLPVPSAALLGQELVRLKAWACWRGLGKPPKGKPPKGTSKGHLQRAPLKGTVVKSAKASQSLLMWADASNVTPGAAWCCLALQELSGTARALNLMAAVTRTTLPSASSPATASLAASPWSPSQAGVTVLAAAPFPPQGHQQGHRPRLPVSAGSSAWPQLQRPSASASTFEHLAPATSAPQVLLDGLVAKPVGRPQGTDPAAPLDRPGDPPTVLVLPTPPPPLAAELATWPGPKGLEEWHEDVTACEQHDSQGGGSRGSLVESAAQWLNLVSTASSVTGLAASPALAFSQHPAVGKQQGQQEQQGQQQQGQQQQGQQEQQEQQGQQQQGQQEQQGQQQQGQQEQQGQQGQGLGHEASAAHTAAAGLAQDQRLCEGARETGEGEPGKGKAGDGAAELLRPSAAQLRALMLASQSLEGWVKQPCCQVKGAAPAAQQTGPGRQPGQHAAAVGCGATELQPGGQGAEVGDGADNVSQGTAQQQSPGGVSQAAGGQQGMQARPGGAADMPHQAHGQGPDFSWHEVQAHLVPHPLGLAGSGGGCAQLLVLVQHDVTQYVEAQLEVKKVLDGSWRLLEEIFPLHVLQTMTSMAMSRVESKSNAHNALLPSASTQSGADQRSSSQAGSSSHELAGGDEKWEGQWALGRQPQPLKQQHKEQQQVKVLQTMPAEGPQQRPLGCYALTPQPTQPQPTPAIPAMLSSALPQPESSQATSALLTIPQAALSIAVGASSTPPQSPSPLPSTPPPLPQPLPAPPPTEVTSPGLSSPSAPLDFTGHGVPSDPDSLEGATLAPPPQAHGSARVTLPPPRATSMPPPGSSASDTQQERQPGPAPAPALKPAATPALTPPTATTSAASPECPEGSPALTSTPVAGQALAAGPASPGPGATTGGLRLGSQRGSAAESPMAGPTGSQAPAPPAPLATALLKRSVGFAPSPAAWEDGPSPGHAPGQGGPALAAAVGPQLPLPIPGTGFMLPIPDLGSGCSSGSNVSGPCKRPVARASSRRDGEGLGRWGASSSAQPPPPTSRELYRGTSTTVRSSVSSAAVTSGSCATSSMARHHACVTVLFADIRGFTTMCNTLPPEEVMMFLNGMFTAFDALVEQHGLYKIETIGDALMVAGGLLQVGPDGVARINDSPEGDTQHATRTLAFARDMLRTANTIVMPRGQPQDTVQLRVGIHTGSCMSGVVGRKMPRFCLFGDTINTASRMESTGQAQCVQVSQATWQALGHAPVLAADLLPPELVGAGGEQAGPGATYPAGVLRAEPRWRASGGVEAKGKGVMQTYVWKEQGWVQ
ncbi:hypothetical protein QJQ45_007864 [Haematococcus lacustris]|nr:hypothetical protein QJQ45_007864 [Haematococcus lacustris]